MIQAVKAADRVDGKPSESQSSALERGSSLKVHTLGFPCEDQPCPRRHDHRLVLWRQAICCVFHHDGAG